MLQQRLLLALLCCRALPPALLAHHVLRQTSLNSRVPSISYASLPDVATDNSTSLLQRIKAFEATLEANLNRAPVEPGAAGSLLMSSSSLKVTADLVPAGALLVLHVPPSTVHRYISSFE